MYKIVGGTKLDLPTLIFDEIDTGISGEAARQVGIIMKELASKRQVICITHQPQIAGKADAHFFVYKEIVKDEVKTNIRLLNKDERSQLLPKCSVEKSQQPQRWRMREKWWELIILKMNVMSLNPIGFLLFIIIAALPAYYLNKWMIKLTRPKDSFGRLMLYFLLSLIVAMAYSAMAIFIITRFYTLPKK